MRILLFQMFGEFLVGGALFACKQGEEGGEISSTARRCNKYKCITFTQDCVYVYIHT